MKRISLFLLSLLMFQLSANTANDLSGVAANNVKVPFYQKGALQSMIFADRAEYRAQLLYGHEVIINMLQKKVNPDRIRNDWRLKFYPLGAPLSDIARFWAGRLHYCDAVIYTPEGALNQTENSAASDREVKLRSPLLDLDGVGFAADFKRRQIKVNSNVRIILRGKNCDPRFFGSKVPSQYDFVRCTSDMLHMDTAKKRIMLLGKVTVIDKQIKLTCDRLTVELGGEKSLQEKSSMDFSGVRMLHADGNVKVVKLLPPGASAADSQELTGDHLVYDVAREQLTVTGDRKPPMIKTGKGFMLRGRELVYFQKKQQLIVPRDCWMCVEEKGEKRYLLSDYGNFNFATGICDFLGNVRGSAPQNELACSKMRVFLQRASKKDAAQKTTSKASSPLGGISTPGSGSFEFKRALCRDNVKVFRREKEQGISTLNAKEADIDYLKDKALFTGDVRCTSGGNTLETPMLTVNLKKSAADPRRREVESAEASQKVRITGTPDGKGETSVITADRGFFDYKKDRIDFIGNVSSTRGKSSLTSDRLELFLGEKAKGEKSASIPGVASGAAGSGKTLKRVLATGNAVMKDDENTLAGDMLEYFFVPAQPGAAEKPGMFQSGSLRLVQVNGSGNVKLGSRENAEPRIPGSSAPEKHKADAGVMLGRNAGFRQLTANQMVSDFRKHTTVFTGKVSVTDGGSRMDSEKLELFAKTQQPSAAGTAPKTNDPDADPFELPAENSVPSAVALGNGLELDRAVASENVVIKRRPNAVEAGQTVYCDRAFFNSADMTILCTSADGRRPKAVGSGKTHTADKFTIFLKDERLESSGDTVTQ